MDNVALIAKNIKLLILDVDGVLTDGGLYYDATGCAMKRFNVQDGFGIKMAQAAGLEIGVISGLDHKPVEKRVRELGITHYYAGKHKKVPLVEDICQKIGIDPSEAAFLGDDWIDVSAMRRVGLGMAVSNALPEVLDEAAWVATRAGGHGAVREAIAFLLDARGQLDEFWKEWAG